MSQPGWSAPGKILLAGEYAVLEGAEAIVMAVDRRARAQVGEAAARLSPFLQAALDVVEEEHGPDSAEAHAARRVVVDSSALADDGTKLGLGSSAAATVSALAAALAVGGGAVDRARVHALAHRAHREAQGGRGSGADVAASTWGGVLAVRQTGDVATPLATRTLALPASLHLVAVWTGHPANTLALVSRMFDFHARDPAGYLASVGALATPAAALIGACERGDAAAAVDAIRAGRVALAGLGAAARLDLETDAVRRVAIVAEERGGAVKPTGAGGGDIAIAAFTDASAVADFRADLTIVGMKAVDVGVDTRGVRQDPA